MTTSSIHFLRTTVLGQSASPATKLTVVLLFAVLGLAVPKVRAAVVLSNLDPAEYATSEATETDGTQVGQSVLTGNTPISLSGVLFPQGLGLASGESFAVYSRNADGTLGSSLFTGFTLSYDSDAAVTTATVNGSFTLQANTDYWLVASAPDNLHWDFTGTTDYSSNDGVTLPALDTAFSIGPDFLAYYNLSDGPQLIQLDGSAVSVVPEPSAYTLIGLALAGAIGVMARRRRIVI